jgi:hypothetical protein
MLCKGAEFRFWVSDFLDWAAAMQPLFDLLQQYE